MHLPLLIIHLDIALEKDIAIDRIKPRLPAANRNGGLIFGVKGQLGHDQIHFSIQLLLGLVGLKAPYDALAFAFNNQRLFNIGLRVGGPVALGWLLRASYLDEDKGQYDATDRNT